MGNIAKIAGNLKWEIMKIGKLLKGGIMTIVKLLKLRDNASRANMGDS